MDTQYSPDVKLMLAKYKQLRDEGFNHASAAHAVISNMRGKYRTNRRAAFFANPYVAAEAMKFNAGVKL